MVYLSPFQSTFPSEHLFQVFSLGMQILRWSNNAGFSEGGILRLMSEKGRCQSDGELGVYSNLGAESLSLW